MVFPLNDKSNHCDGDADEKQPHHQINTFAKTELAYQRDGLVHERQLAH